ncbi:MAG: GntR family transcriptional regulator [Peptococcaceae bacterium]|nr:GntR family transcriptional regulator [Peptococcaceae bacterium]
MTIDPHSEKPIFIQIAEQLEDAIFTGIYPEGEKVPSTNEIAALLSINPHTVLKGMNLLVEEGIIYKKRGLGMFVSDGAMSVILKKRQSQFYERYIEALVVEAKKLSMTKDDVIALIERGYDNERDRD